MSLNNYTVTSNLQKDNDPKVTGNKEYRHAVTTDYNKAIRNKPHGNIALHFSRYIFLRLLTNFATFPSTVVDPHLEN